MESRLFIRNVATLITDIKDSFLLQDISGVEHKSRLQKEIDRMFAGLQNPTLPSAYKLRDVAFEYGFTVDPRVQHRLAQFESI